MPKSLHRDFPYTRNVKADLHLMGFPVILNPFAQFVSAPRAGMYAGHNAQSVLIHGAEFPQCFTGYEYEMGRFTFERELRERDQDVEIIAVIPKYPALRLTSGMGTNTPHLIVIYRGDRDNRIGYFTVSRFFKGSDGFGHENTWLNRNRLEPGLFLPKDMPLSASPAQQYGDRYCLGTNFNTAYMSLPEVEEDAIVIREGAHKKATSTAFETAVINFRHDRRPIYYFGDDYEPRFLLDIGETVGKDGILCAFRPVSTTTCAADTDPLLLKTPLCEQDDVYRAPPGARIVDIDFIVNHQRMTPAYGQIDKYIKSSKSYWNAIYEVYLSIEKKYKLTPRFNKLVDTAMSRLLVQGENLRNFPKVKVRPELDGVNGQPVDFIQAVITYSYDRPANDGVKFANRHG